MNSRGFTESMAAHVLSYESSPKRFEDFCVEVFRDIEQVEYVRTSSSWDHGRDGRDSSTRTGPIPPFLCSTLRSDVLVKGVSDVKRILETGKPERVIVCCASPVSEDLAIKVEGEIRAIASEVETARVNGSEQLTQLSMRYPRAMESLYVGELAELRGVCAADTSLADEDSLTGLRIALTTQLHEDAQERRRDLVRNLVLTGLSERSHVNLAQIANSVSQSLHLPRTVQVAFLQPELESLVESGHVAREQEHFRITALGEQEVARRLEHGRSRLCVGGAEIRNLIEQLTGTPVINDEWKAVWRILQEGVGIMLLSRGAEVIEEVASIIEGESHAEELPNFRDQIEEIGKRIQALPGAGGRLDEIAQAAIDMFYERTTKAFEWLAELCAVFIDLCSLGLEPRSQEQILSELRYFALLLDTDIVLSLLSEGEPNHQQVQAVVAGWCALGARVLVAVPALEEASHHAFIADFDYEPTWRLLHLMTDEDALHDIENVFVRGFRVAAKGKYHPSRWRQYISAFRGSSDHDYDKILGLLGDHDVGLLRESDDDKELARRLEGALFNERKGDCSKDPREIANLREKCNRDGRLGALLVGERQRIDRAHETLVIVSSSAAMRLAVHLSGHGSASPGPVMRLSAVAWLLSLAPGVRLTLGTLRGVLFDAGFRKHLSPIERLVVRTVRVSNEYNLHWSRRNTLQREVRNQMGKIAAERGERPSQIEKKATANDERAKEILTSAIAEALDQTSRSRSEEDVQRLQARVAELEKELQVARRTRRSLP